MGVHSLSELGRAKAEDEETNDGEIYWCDDDKIFHPQIPKGMLLIQ